jgi:glycosyl hydrolase, family 31
MIQWKPSLESENFLIQEKEREITAKWDKENSTLTIYLPYNGVYGLGERFNGINQFGKKVVIEVFEKFCNQGNVSYCPMPFFFTDTNFSLFVVTGAVCTFDFSKNGEINVTAPKDCKFIFNFGTPKSMLADFINFFGTPKLPPEWTFGIWISANHWDSQAKTEKQIELLKQYKFPATVIVLEAWSDEATFYIFNGAKYIPKQNGEPHNIADFDFSDSLYWQNPLSMIKKLHDEGLHLVLWQIPVYKKQGTDELPSIQNELDCIDAVSRGLCVHNIDKTPYKIPKGHWFEDSMIPDFTNPETCKTWFEKRKYLLDLGVDGFKTDGGEFIYNDDIILFNGMTGKDYHNYYAKDYTEAYTNFIGESRVLFSRAGYLGQHTTPCLWSGDQQSTNEELRHVLSAGLSAALSGIIFWGFDIGGFAGTLPSADLYLRATKLACFVPIMQWHSEPDGGQFKELMPSKETNNERSPWNIANAYSDFKLLEELRFWHWLRINLYPYLVSTGKKCVDENIPMIRPLILEWNEDIAVNEIEDEFLLGDTLLVAPLLEENSHSREVYLPSGIWYSLFTRERFEGNRYIRTKADMKFPVFLREGFILPLLVEKIENLGKPIENWIDKKNITILPVGEKGEGSFFFEGKVISCNWEHDFVNIKGADTFNISIVRI